jgi:hypothetical protein
LQYKFGNRYLEMGGKYLTELRDSDDIMDNTDALRQRMAEEGYLLFRGFHDRDDILQARGDILNKLAAEPGRIDPDYPVSEGIVGPNPRMALFGGTNEDTPSLLKVANSPKLMQFFERFLGGEVLTYDYKWPRAVPTGKASGCHYDIVYMGRGTPNLYTVWTPLGDVPKELGSLALCLGSQHFTQVKEVYGTLDVDRDKTNGGILTEDPVEIVDQFGGKWATTDFRAGDIIIFGMFILHFALKNDTNCYRTSMDTRYQLKSEPADERWIGQKPIGHYSRKEDTEKQSLQNYRQQLGLSESFKNNS